MIDDGLEILQREFSFNINENLLELNQNHLNSKYNNKFLLSKVKNINQVNIQLTQLNRQEQNLQEMLRIQQRLISFSIVSHKIAHTSRQYHRDPALNLYPVVGLTDVKLGTISLNQPNNQNFLTMEMMAEIFRFLNSYHHDHSVENVWIQNRGSMFLGGLSFQQLIQNPDYLDKLYKMTVMIAKLNKPIFALAKGGVRNVGAYVLNMAAVAMTDHSSNMRIDQVSKGFIPVAGGSHTLSRLPLKVGIYLALTGRRLDANEMSRLGFITAVAKQGVSSKDMRSKISKSNLFFRQRIRVRSFDKTHDNQFQQWTKILKKQQHLKQQISVNQSEIIQSQRNIFCKFAMNQYKVAQLNFENATKPYNSFSIKHGRHINNYFKMRHQLAFRQLLDAGMVEKSEFKELRLSGFKVYKILNCFEQKNLLEVLKALEKDGSEWAKETEREIRKMDPLAAVLTFELLKRAEGMPWDQCLELEYTVGKRLLKASKLALKETYGGSKHILVNNYSSSRIQDIPIQSVLQHYFNPNLTQQQQLQRQVPRHSLLPNTNYISIPDSARLAMNQQYFDDIHLENQDAEMKRWLEANKINYRHKSYDIHALREKIYNQHEYELVKQNEIKRLEYIVNKSTVLKQFVEDRFKYIDWLSDLELEKFLEGVVKKVVNNGIEARFQEFNQTASIIGKEKKLQLFKNLRKILVNKIVLNGTQVEENNTLRNDIFKGIVYFNNQNKSIFETTNPHLKNHQPLKKLVEEVTQKGQITEEFAQNEGAQPKDPHLGVPNQITKRENFLKRVNDNIAKRYQEYPHEWMKAHEYKELVNEAAKTSQQLAQYAQWDASSFYNTILNSPATPVTYADFGQKFLDKFSKEQQDLKTSLRTQAVLAQTFSQEFFSLVYQTTQPSTYKPSSYIREQIIPKFALNKQIQKFMAPLLDQVLRTFQQKYYAEALQEKKLEFGEFDKYIFEAQDKEFVEFYKNDILFVYSYFAILKVKEVLHNLKVSGVKENPEDYMAFFRQYGIEFEQDRTVETMSRVLSKFLFSMLDVHTIAKAKVRLPQNKLLDFLNRTKIYRETKLKSQYPLSFESLLLMIGKDRSRLYNKVLRQFLPTQSQYLLQAANLNTRDPRQEENLSKGSPASLYYTFEHAVTSNHLEKKRLVAGYHYYLALFDSFIQRASGKYNFVCDEINALDPKKIKQELSSVINLKETPKEWFERCAEVAVKNFFNERLQFEKTLTKGELLAFDQEMKELVSPETFRLVMKFVLQSQIESTKDHFQQTRHYTYETSDSEKHQEMYCQIRRNVKNPQAFKRLNNLNLAIQVQNEYFENSLRKGNSPQEKEDLVQEKREFMNYERFPKQTFSRLSRQIYEYGDERNFDHQLNPIGQTQIQKKTIPVKLHFIDDERQTRRKETKFTDFDEEIKLLRNSISKNGNLEEVDSIYKKLEELM